MTSFGLFIFEKWRCITAHFHQSGKLERAPFKWARPIQVSAPLSINHANLSAPLSSERTPFKWARPFPSIRRPSQEGAPFPIYQTVSQELRMNGGLAKTGTSLQKLNEDSYTSVPPVSCLSSSRLRCWRGCVTGSERAPVIRARSRKVVLFTIGNLLIQHTVSRWCSSGCVHEGCGSVNHWLQTEDWALPGFLL